MSPITHLNPEALPANPAFSYAVRVDGGADTLYIGGQNAVRPDGTIAEGMGAQAEQALDNLQTVLESAGASREHIVKWTVLAVQGQPLEDGIAAFRKVWGNRSNPPAISVAVVAGLANPQFLVEIEAIAAVPSG